MKCPFCNGEGKRYILVNQDALYDGFENPVVETEPCEECGGTGQHPKLTGE
jgi:hypothetical protein